MFGNRVLLITGGTGSFGNAVLKRFLASDLREIRIFSRDEKKQDDMRKRYDDPKLKFYIGDVRDSRSVAAAMRGVDFCFHAAALKQVPSCEFHPMEAVRTNVLGTENVLEAGDCRGREARRVPQHRQGGLSHQRDGYFQGDDGKGHGRDLAQSRGHRHRHLRHALRQRDGLARFGHSAVRRAGSGRAGRSRSPIPAMTRFMMTLDEAVELVLYAFAARQERRHLRAEGAGRDGGGAGAGAARGAGAAAITRSAKSARGMARSSTRRCSAARRWPSAEDLRRLLSRAA